MAYDSYRKKKKIVRRRPLPTRKSTSSSEEDIKQTAGEWRTKREYVDDDSVSPNPYLRGKSSTTTKSTTSSSTFSSSTGSTLTDQDKKKEPEKPPSPPKKPDSPPKKSPSPEKKSPSPEKKSPSPEKKSTTPKKKSPSPEKKSPSPEKQSPSPEKKSPSPEKKTPSPESKSTSPEKKSTSPEKKSPSPESKSTSPKRKSTSPEREPSPKRKSTSPKRESTSPERKSTSPERKSTSPKRKSTSPERKSTSPEDKSASPERKSTSPKRKSTSPERKSTSPERKSTSPKRKSTSPERKSTSPERKSTSPKRKSTSPKRKSTSPGKKSPSPSKKSPSPVQDVTDKDKKSLTISRRSPSPDKKDASIGKKSTTASKRSPSPEKRGTIKSKRSPSPDQRDARRKSTAVSRHPAGDDEKDWPDFDFIPELGGNESIESVKADIAPPLSERYDMEDEYGISKAPQPTPRVPLDTLYDGLEGSHLTASPAKATNVPTKKALQPMCTICLVGERYKKDIELTMDSKVDNVVYQVLKCMDEECISFDGFHMQGKKRTVRSLLLHCLAPFTSFFSNNILIQRRRRTYSSCCECRTRNTPCHDRKRKNKPMHSPGLLRKYGRTLLCSGSGIGKGRNKDMVVIEICPSHTTLTDDYHKKQKEQGVGTDASPELEILLRGNKYRCFSRKGGPNCRCYKCCPSSKPMNLLAKPHHEKPHEEKPHHEKPHEEKPHHEKPHEEKPHHEKPHEENPHHEHHEHHEKPHPEESHHEKPHHHHEHHEKPPPEESSEQVTEEPATDEPQTETHETDEPSEVEGKKVTRTKSTADEMGFEKNYRLLLHNTNAVGYCDSASIYSSDSFQDSRVFKRRPALPVPHGVRSEPFTVCSSRQQRLGEAYKNWLAPILTENRGNKIRSKRYRGKQHSLNLYETPDGLGRTVYYGSNESRMVCNSDQLRLRKLFQRSHISRMSSRTSSDNETVTMVQRNEELPQTHYTTMDNEQHVASPSMEYLQDESSKIVFKRLPTSKKSTNLLAFLENLRSCEDPSKSKSTMTINNRAKPKKVGNFEKLKIYLGRTGKNKPKKFKPVALGKKHGNMDLSSFKG